MADRCELAEAIPRRYTTGESAPGSLESGNAMVIRQRFSLQEVRDVLGGLLEQDLHVKRVDSLCNATLGVLHSASLAVCAVGQGLAAARSLKLKHAVKQVDRWIGCCPIQPSTSPFAGCLTSSAHEPPSWWPWIGLTLMLTTKPRLCW